MSDERFQLWRAADAIASGARDVIQGEFKTVMAETLRDDPRTNINWHIHRAGCPNYRERWFADTDLQAGEPLYQVFCLLNTPPVTTEEQNKCLRSHNGCWRLKERRQAQADASAEPAQPA